MRFTASILATVAVVVGQTTAAHNVRASTFTTDGVRRQLQQCNPDGDSPTASCETSFELGVGATITVDDVDMGSTDDCDTSATPVLVGDPLVGTCDLFNAGSSTLVEIMITDATGNSATCATPVTVVDRSPPTAICKDLTVALSGSGSATIAASDVDDGSFDDCTGVSLSVTPTTFGCGEIGSNTVTLTATDTSMNSDTCTATVTVTEDSPPVLTCPVAGQTFDLESGTNTVTVDFGVTATDNCDTSVDINPAQFEYGCANVREETATIRATDDAGNFAECMVTNTIRDPEPPTITCGTTDVTLELSSIDTSVTLDDFAIQAADNCNSLTTVFESSNAGSITYTCADVGTYTETVTTTDQSSNQASCMVTITVVDNDPPDADCVPATVGVDANGVATIAVTDVNNFSDDNCGLSSLELDTTSVGCSDIGPTPVEVFLTATDTAGLTTACSAQVSVVDEIAPVATVCNDVTLALPLGSSGTATLDASTFSAVDNCGGVVTTTLSKTTFACGESGPITVTFTDEYSNQSTCNPTVIVDACPDSPTSAPADDPVDPADVSECDFVCVALGALGGISLLSIGAAAVATIGSICFFLFEDD